jgi:D-sedoheptulose 7-phosphate isomerase
VTFIQNMVSALTDLNPVVLDHFKKTVREWKGSILILGNGGSNAIASHMAEDYTKALGKRAISFSDSARMSCYANDYGYENAFSQFTKEFSDSDSLVILISSSGNSKNIVNCARYCSENSIPYVLLTGFESENSIRSLYSSGAIHDFWVDSKDYGVVECTHEIILHSVI